MCNGVLAVSVSLLVTGRKPSAYTTGPLTSSASFPTSGTVTATAFTAPDVVGDLGLNTLSSRPVHGLGRPWPGLPVRTAASFSALVAARCPSW
jgi:hypothetical protein